MTCVRPSRRLLACVLGGLLGAGLVVLFALSVASRAGEADTPPDAASPRLDNTLAAGQPLTIPFPRLGMWWPDPLTQPITDIARYDWVHRRMEQCSSLTVSGLELEAAVWSDIEEFVRQPHLVVAELRKRRGPAGAELAVRLAEVDRAIAERKAEIDRYLELYGRGKFPIEQLDAKVDEVRGHLTGLEAYRDQLVDEQRRSDLWEREMIGVIEALVALQEKLDAGLTFDDKVTLVKMLVKGIMIETCADEAGEKYAKAHVVYRFERPDVSEMAIPIELEPLFSSAEMATNWLNLGTGI